MTNKTLKENNSLRIADLSLAAFLFLHYPLETIERPKKGKKSFFIFKKDAQTDKLVAIFWRGQANCEPQLYFNALRTIKTRLYGEK